MNSAVIIVVAIIGIYDGKVVAECSDGAEVSVEYDAKQDVDDLYSALSKLCGGK